MDYLNIDAMGKEYRYGTEAAAIEMGHHLPWAWKCIALAVRCQRPECNEFTGRC